MKTKKTLLKLLLFFVVATFANNVCYAQQNNKKISVIDSTKKVEIVEAACGECQFKMAGKGCDLAVRINGKAYFVEGTTIDEHGDAHAKEGFCEAVRKAEVQGEIVGDKYKATYFKLLKTN